MSFIDAIILGIVEGFTEFLPISSTAHLVLTSRLLGLETSEFIKTFEIAIQLGAIAAVIYLYRKTLFTKWELNKKILIAFLPTAFIGLAFYRLLKNILLENHLISVYALLIGGIAIIVFELMHKEKEGDVADLDAISYPKAMLIGIFQSIAIIPGVSRSAATVLGGMSIGIKRKTIVEFSFLLAIPTMIAATTLDLVRSIEEFSKADLQNLGVGFTVSFVTALIGISFLLKYIQNNDFKSFGLYRIIIALGFLFFV